MSKRPSLSDSSFLGHLFSPKKHALPTGIRKTTLKGGKGQSKGRIAAFNRMTPFKQELLKRSGTRDSYLRGESTLADAKNALRTQAVQLKLARPVKPRKPIFVQTELDKRIARYLKLKHSAESTKWNPNTIDAEIVYLGDNADENMLSWDSGRIKYAGRKGSEYEVIGADGKTHNAFWYH